MWEVKFKLGIFRQKPSFLSRGTFLSRANVAQEIECGFASVTGIALSYERAFLGLLWFYSEPNTRIDWKLLGFQACPDFSTVLSWPTMWRGEKTQLPEVTTWQQPRETLYISPIICSSFLCMDSRWVLVHCWWTVPPAQVQPLYHQQPYGVREKHSKWVDPEEKCNWMWQLLQAQASLPQSWWVVIFTVTWKEENLKLAMLGIPDWVNCMRTRAPHSILASKLRCRFLRVAQFFFSFLKDVTFRKYPEIKSSSVLRSKGQNRRMLNNWRCPIILRGNTAPSYCLGRSWSNCQACSSPSLETCR